MFSCSRGCSYFLNLLVTLGVSPLMEGGETGQKGKGEKETGAGKYF